MHWTVEKVTSLAPDFGAEQRGQALAAFSKWLSVGKRDMVLWGECKGSGSQPYRTHIDTQELAFGCTCPTRKHPCKHALGLLYLLVQSPDGIATASPPEWVQQWLDKRHARINKKEKTEESSTEESPDKLRRQEQKMEQIEGALAVFEQWLSDAVRQGLAQLPVHDSAFWEQISALLADAGLSRLRQTVKLTSIYIKHHNEWTDYLLERVGEWYSLLLAFRKREQLPPLMLEDMLNQLGRTVFKKDVLAKGENLSDHWYILGQYEGENVDNIPFRQVWLYGLASGRYATLLDYKFGDQAYEHHFVQGATLVGALAFYPSQYPQRAVVDTFITQEPIETHWQSGFAAFEDCQLAFANALGLNPWLDEFPAIFLDVIPILQDNQFFLMDEQRRLLPVNRLFEEAFWQLMSNSGGSPITVFGTFDGKMLDPYSIFTFGRWRALAG